MTRCSLQKTLVMRRDARSAEEGVQEFDSCAALVQDVLMTARDEILAVLPAVCARTVDGTFTPQDVIDELRRHGSTYAPSTIRTHVVSRMCANAPDQHARTYDDLERVADGRYRCR
jgi:hypothetical protein